MLTPAKPQVTATRRSLLVSRRAFREKHNLSSLHTSAVLLQVSVSSVTKTPHEWASRPAKTPSYSPINSPHVEPVSMIRNLVDDATAKRFYNGGHTRHTKGPESTSPSWNTAQTTAALR